MTLKLIIAKLEDVEEQFRNLYKMAADGKYHLDTEEDEESKAKLKEFRDNNIKLMKELETLQNQLKSIGDPAKIEEMKKKIQLIEDKQMIEAGKLDELVAQKVERMKQDYENQITALKDAVDKKQTELEKKTTQLSSVLIDSEITRAVTAAGVPRKGALDDLIARGRRVWHLDEDGKPIPKDGDKILYGKDGKAAMTFDEWAAVQKEVAPYLFEATSGSNAHGDKGKGGTTTTETLSKIPVGGRLAEVHKMGITK